MPAKVPELTGDVVVLGVLLVGVLLVGVLLVGVLLVGVLLVGVLLGGVLLGGVLLGGVLLVGVLLVGVLLGGVLLGGVLLVGVLLVGVLPELPEMEGDDLACGLKPVPALPPHPIRNQGKLRASIPQIRCFPNLVVSQEAADDIRCG